MSEIETNHNGSEWYIRARRIEMIEVDEGGVPIGTLFIYENHPDINNPRYIQQKPEGNIKDFIYDFINKKWNFNSYQNGDGNI